MNRQELLAAFDRELRADIRLDEPGLRVERAPGYVRIVGPSSAAHDNCVIYSNIGDGNVDAAITKQLAFFGGLGRDFEWKLFDHDAPPELSERLIAHGFEPDTPETVLVMRLTESSDAAAASAIEIRRVVDPGGLADIVSIQDAVWHEDHAWLADTLSREMRTAPDNIHILVAGQAGRPVACSWMRIHAGTQFASLWGAAVLPEHRGRRIYASLVQCHCGEARRRGARFVYVDANGNSRPVLEKVGFKALVGVRGYLWRNAKESGPIAAIA